MRHRALGSRGVSLYELLIVAAVFAVLAGIAVPLSSLAVSRARRTGVAEMLGATIRDARARATLATGGFEYRVRAFDATGAVGPPNAFRIEGRNPTAGPFPAAGTTNDPPSYGVNQMNEAYVDLVREFPGTQIQFPGGGNEFTVTFDSSGQWPVAEQCVPNGCQVQVINRGRTATITVSAAGAVLIVK